MSITTEELAKLQKAIKRAYFEGYNDHLYKSTEYMREVCWRQSEATKSWYDVENIPLEPDV